MRKLRISVEWGFGKINQYFGFLDFHENLRVLLQLVAKYYLVGTLLTNCHTYLYGSVGLGSSEAALGTSRWGLTGSPDIYG